MRKSAIPEIAVAEAGFTRRATAHDRNHVTSLQKGLEVLCAFSRKHNRLTVSEVAQLTGSSPASARRSLLTLQAVGFLQGDGKHFWMAPKSLLVAHAYLSSRPTPSLAQPLLDALAERSRQSASLAQLLETDAIIIARSTARRSLSTGLGIGSRLPAYCSAVGRVLLGSLSPDEVQRRLRATRFEKLTPSTVVKLADVTARVDEARRLGHATSDEELETGVRSMAVPVYNREGVVVAALSSSVRAERMAMAEFRDHMLPLLLRAQEQLAKTLF